MGDEVKGALENKINSIQAATQPLLAKEEKEMRDSIDASGSQIAKAVRDSAHNAADAASQADANPKATPPSPESSAGGAESEGAAGAEAGAPPAEGEAAGAY